TSFSSVTPSFLTIDEYSSTRPAAPVQISTQSIVLEGGGTNEFTKSNLIEALRASKPTSDRIYDSEHDSKRNTALSKSTNLIAFVGAQAFNVGEQFETLQADESLSNLDRDEVIAIVVGNADLTTDQLYCFNNLQMILPLNSSYSSQLFTDSRICVEHIMAKEWITDKADTTMALILNLFRRPLKSTGNDEQRWLAGRKAIAHSVLGIVGLGRVGLAVLDRARRFQFDVVFYDPGVQARTEDALGVKRASSLRVRFIRIS
ncbi:unnamed protein product, partial [Anisakis simplex]|uniref:C-terminal-binding protein (inferred by orthology to a D. melanogaster protein) n=1 Tax=Anisakis simplex TaxID=6269 RepID=A0A0M3JT63_ANISI